MAPSLTLKPDGPDFIISAVPLDSRAFSPFGDVVENPRPDLHPSVASRNHASSSLPLDGIVANQGTAIKYQHLSRMANHYHQAPSGNPGVAVMNMFVCSARLDIRSSEPGLDEFASVHVPQLFPVSVLERHPFTTQTFIPLTTDDRKRYLVIVAPSLPPAIADQALPVPVPGPADAAASRRLPGRGLPDVRRLRAFIARTNQAVTYGPGTWHAPMVALGPADTAIDFVVVQFSNGVGIEDCQEVALASASPAESGGRIAFLDLSGVESKQGENPYNALINACHARPAEIQSRYTAHRTARNLQQREKFLSSEFKGLNLDPVLLRIEDPEEPGFQDPRNCLVFWARPPDHVLTLASHVQALLKNAAPSLWLMPLHRMHLTTLEVTHSRKIEEISSLVASLRPVISALTNFTFTHRSRLVKPLISYDLSAIALSFLPAAGEEVLSPKQTVHSDVLGDNVAEKDGCYTYHHLRRDVFELAQSTGVKIESRYVVPSAHITLARYVSQGDHDSFASRIQWIEAIEEINKWLEDEVWDVAGKDFLGEWIVGQERGLDARTGTLWYGGGRTIMVGEGF
ncbi:ureidoglycolate hydrolase [Lasiosphaeria miniovina]|uniref:Ureidoglycolate hydrolase n=1 Tax=Lasiosphaeria miniovina TaxID=1954250 RepID=A0AA40BFJ2_9PEZI|nr:ureidoglycolate hydrolase [Lasiosphaeria miniovina]KAK0733321.1 ureidoglycolate hydrolase [Lasiosphaeria miniovina]